MDAIALPIQLDAPVVVFDTDGNEYKIESAVMREGRLCLYLGEALDSEPVEDEEEL